MDVVMIKGEAAGAPDRTYLGSGPGSRRVAVHVVHDLPHLVVESLFGISDGLWAELASGAHNASNRAATARDPRRQKQGRIVSGEAAGEALDAWLSDGHRRAKTVTNAVANRFGDGSDTPTGVRERIASSGEQASVDLVAGIDDELIAAAIAGVREVERRWIDLPPGGTLRLTWPLALIDLER